MIIPELRSIDSALRNGTPFTAIVATDYVGELFEGDFPDCRWGIFIENGERREGWSRWDSSEGRFMPIEYVDENTTIKVIGWLPQS